MIYRCILAWDFRIGVGKADISQYKAIHVQVDSLLEGEDSEYILPVSLLNDLCAWSCVLAQLCERDVVTLLIY